MQKIAFLSDIHGNILALEKVVEDLQRRGVDTVVALGDLVSGPLWPKKTIQFLMKQNWVLIAGNHERQLLTQPPEEQGSSDRYANSQLNDTERDWLRSLPDSLQISDEIMVCHGAPHNDTTYLLETIDHGRTHLSSMEEIQSRLNNMQSPILACGHSHTPRVVHLPEGMLIINPGSVGMPAYTDDGPRPHKVENGSPHARYAILERNLTAWNVEMLAIPYDHNKAARQAVKNNRPEYEIAFLTGYVSTK